MFWMLVTTMSLAVFACLGCWVSIRKGYRDLMTEKALEEWRQHIVVDHHACPQCCVGSYVCDQHRDEWSRWQSTARWVLKSRPEVRRLTSTSASGAPFGVPTKLS